MKITQVEVIPVWYEVTDAYNQLFGSGKKAGSSVHSREGWFADIDFKENVFVKMHTDEGIIGWGEATAHPVTSETQAGLVSTIQLFAGMIIGRDPFEIGAFHAEWDHMFLQANAGARSALDIAVHDIMGKATGQPIYKLLAGGYFQTSFGLMGTMPRHEPKVMAEMCKEHMERGYTCFEPKMTGHKESLDADADRLEAILDVVPQDCLIMADPNQGWGTAQDTIELMHRRFPTTPNLAIEQPVMYHDTVGLEQITRAIPQKVIADEALQHLPSIIDIVSRRVADMTSFKLGKCGGFYKAMQMVRISEAANVPVRIDWTQGSHLLDTATGHLHACVRLAACDPGMDYQLRIKDKPVAEGGVKVENKQFVMPDTPGLGLTIDEDVIKHLSQRK